jgi:hypothetical protein
MNKRKLAGVVIAICLTAVGCGESSDSKGEVPTSAQIEEAETIVRDELPATPIWEKASFHGVTTNNGDVCVDRIYAKDSAKLLGGDRSAGHVIVSIPEMTTGRPQDGQCEGRPAPSGSKPSAEQRVLDALGDEVSSDLAVGDSQVRSAKTVDQTAIITLSTPEGGFEGPSTDDTNALTSAALAEVYEDAGWTGSARVTFRGGLVDSATGREMPNIQTASYSVDRKATRQIDWSDAEALYAIDWSIYRDLCHPALKGC